MVDPSARHERSLDIEKFEHCVFYRERILDGRTANRQGSRIEASGKGEIRESEEYFSVPAETKDRCRERVFMHMEVGDGK